MVYLKLGRIKANGIIFADKTYTGVLLYWTAGGNDVAYFMSSDDVVNSTYTVVTGLRFGKVMTDANVVLEFINPSEGEDVLQGNNFSFRCHGFGKTDKNGFVTQVTGYLHGHSSSNGTEFDDGEQMLVLRAETPSFDGDPQDKWEQGSGTWSMRYNKSISKLQTYSIQRTAALKKLPSQIKIVAQGDAWVAKETWAGLDGL